MSTNSHFAAMPAKLDRPRSRFTSSDRHLTTFNAGDLIPIKVNLDVLPGDSIKMKTSFVIRSATPIHPTMDDAFFDLYAFFVPNRLLWDHWENFMGANPGGYWVDSTVYAVPYVQAASGTGFPEGSLADYMRIPTKVQSIKVSALGARAYCLTYNEWFRDHNVTPPVACPTSDSNRIAASAPSSAVLDACDYLSLCKVSKYHDYFTSCLPSPQRSSDTVTVPFIGDVPLDLNLGSSVSPSQLTQPMVYTSSGTPEPDRLIGTNSDGELSEGGTNNDGSYDLFLAGVAKTSKLGININDLRFATQLQKYYEADIYSGGVYQYIIQAHWGVRGSDARFQRPEFLGGGRYKLSMNQVAQTSATEATGTAQGSLAAYSLSCGSEPTFSFSAEEYGVLLVLGCIRTRHTYQQGLHRMWSRFDRTQYYSPEFANIGNQAVLRKELYATGSSASDDAVFGYQEAWAEYRYEQNGVSGCFRHNNSGTLDSWHYADWYASTPYLSQTWVEETSANVDRTIAVSERLGPQFIADFQFDMDYTRCMPMYSVPGMMDHH